jgi:hypothetical protein
MAVILTATAGFGALPAQAKTANPKPACCRPAHCLSYAPQMNCCRADSDSPAPTAPVSPVSKAETSAPVAAFITNLPAANVSVHRLDPSFYSSFSTAPPLFSLKSSFLI